LVGFVLGGRAAHNIGGGIPTFLTILWPLAVGWFAVAWAVGLYARSARPLWARLLLTWGLGLSVGLLLRALVTGGGTPVAFVAVAGGFMGATTVAWRLLGAGLWRFQAGRAPHLSQDT
jgi:hypothetical protein